jgi:hypothetical protein
MKHTFIPDPLLRNTHRFIPDKLLHPKQPAQQ